MKNLILWLIIISSIIIGCKSPANKNTNHKKAKAVIGFLDAFVDETIEQAKLGFYAALAENGFPENDTSITILYRNAQSDIPTLTQACDYFIAEKVDIIATNATLSTITAVQKTNTIPICMMVSPSPANARLLDAEGNAPKNLFGVYETLAYIDTSVTLINYFFPNAKHLGVIYNQAEPQSVNALEHIQAACKLLKLKVSVVSVSNSSETQLAMQSLINKGIDCFFAMPDNSIFASFEVIAEACKSKKIPVFTSEAGLVKRGALCAYGADLFAWGYQAGMQAVKFINGNKKVIPQPELVIKRIRVINAAVAKDFSIKYNLEDFSQF
ncbi:MAG TPA: ABC transporter substrate-binding protein [Bacteroidia bacterium]|nr:ABC transporter substrate-binding protein [Bacteroidia bacterium]